MPQLLSPPLLESAPIGERDKMCRFEDGEEIGVEAVILLVTHLSFSQLVSHGMWDHRSSSVEISYER